MSSQLGLNSLESLQVHFYSLTVQSEKRIITNPGEGAPGFVKFSELQIPGSFRGQRQNPPFTGAESSLPYNKFHKIVTGMTLPIKI